MKDDMEIDMELIGAIENVSWLLILLWASVAYFVYNGIWGIVAIVLLCGLYELTLLLSLIPYIGFIIQAIVMKFVIWPYVAALTEITASQLTLLIFWQVIVFGALITLKISISTGIIREIAEREAERK